MDKKITIGEQINKAFNAAFTAKKAEKPKDEAKNNKTLQTL